MYKRTDRDGDEAEPHQILNDLRRRLGGPGDHHHEDQIDADQDRVLQPEHGKAARRRPLVDSVEKLWWPRRHWRHTVLVFFLEASLDHRDQRFECGACVVAFRLDQDGMALAGGEHH